MNGAGAAGAVPSIPAPASLRFVLSFVLIPSRRYAGDSPRQRHDRMRVANQWNGCEWSFASPVPRAVLIREAGLARVRP